MTRPASSVRRRKAARPHHPPLQRWTSLGVAIAVVLLLAGYAPAPIPSSTAAQDPNSPSAVSTAGDRGGNGTVPDHPFFVVPPVGGGPGQWSRASGPASSETPTYHLSTTSLATGNCLPNYNRAWLAYDAAIQSFWVAAPASCVEVVSMSGSAWGSVNASITVGTDPFGVAVDDSTGHVFVTNSGSDNVTVLSDVTYTQVVSIPVGTSPYGVAYDWATGEVYVANGGSDNVTVISGTTLSVVASVDVGSAPVGVVADPLSGKVYVADSGSGEVSVISDTSHSVVATVPAGSGPYGLALDNTTNEIFVTNAGSNNLTVIDAATDTSIASISVDGPGINLEGVAYDAAEGLVWAGGGNAYLVVVDATNLTLVGYLSSDPAGAAYDPDTGAVCVTNTANYSFACVTSRWMWPAVQLSFSEVGLPPGVPWAVTLGHSGMNNGTVSSPNPIIRFGVFWPWYFSENYSYWIRPPNGYGANPTSGSVAVGASSIEIAVAFASVPGTYAVTFAESGLPTGTSWPVDLDGTLNRSVSPTNSFRLTNGTAYPFVVARLPYFVPVPFSGVVDVVGSDVTVPIRFLPIPWFPVWFNETGLPAGTLWSVELGGTLNRSTSPAASFEEPNGTYLYAIGPVAGYTPSVTAGSVTVSGAPVSILVTWSELKFDAIFLASGLPTGRMWSVTLGGLTHSTVMPTLLFAEAPGSYDFAVGAVPGYRTSPWSGTVELSNESVSVPILWTESTYYVAFGETGLPDGTSWGVDLQEVGEYQNATGSAAMIGFDLPNGTYDFSVRAPSSYVADPSNGPLGVSGSDQAISVQFFEGGFVVGRLSPSSATLWISSDGVPTPEGRFNATERPGVHAVYVSEDGYLPFVANVTVCAGQSTWLNVSLVPAPASMWSALAGSWPYALGGFALGALVSALATGAWRVRRRRRATRDPGRSIVPRRAGPVSQTIGPSRSRPGAP